MRGWVLCCILVLLCDSSSGQKLQSCTHKHVSVDGRIMMTTIACEMKNTGNGLFSAPPDSFVLTVTGGKKNGNSISSEVVPITNGEGVWGNFQTTNSQNNYKGLYVSTPVVPERIIRSLSGGSCPTVTSAYIRNGSPMTYNNFGSASTATQCVYENIYIITIVHTPLDQNNFISAFSLSNAGGSVFHSLFIA